MQRLTISLRSLPAYTFDGPREVTDEDGHRWELRIAELPDFFLAAAARLCRMRAQRPLGRSSLNPWG